jgi:hypothetical protein
MTAKMPSEAIIQVMPVTTAEVVAKPTAAALVPHCMPRRQPVRAMITPQQEAGEADRLDRACQVNLRRDIEHQGRDQEPAGNGNQVGEDAQQRHHQDQRHHPGQDEELERRDAESLEGFNLLVHFHGAELRR